MAGRKTVKKEAPKAPPANKPAATEPATYRIKPSPPNTTGYIHRNKFYEGDREYALDPATAEAMKARGLIVELEEFAASAPFTADDVEITVGDTVALVPESELGALGDGIEIDEAGGRITSVERDDSGEGSVTPA